MLVVMRRSATDEQIAAVRKQIELMGYRAEPMPGGERTAIGVLGNESRVDDSVLSRMDGVRECIHVTRPFKLVSREFYPENTVVTVGKSRIGGRALAMMAGPCAVEDEEQIMSTARFLASRGVGILRGGAFKPRTSPYAFQGLGLRGLELLQAAGRETGLAVVTEAVDEASLDLVAEYADMVQIGARNMHNYELLKKAGRSGRPVLLKRGMSATIKEFLMAAEYVMNEGCKAVTLCERGIRTFSDFTRNTLDLSAVPVIKEMSHLPVVVDPSHGMGIWDKVTAASRAAVAIGADGLMIEVHPEPEKARSDGAQSLNFPSFDHLLAEVGKIAGAVDRTVG